MMPAREALAALLLPVLLVGALFLVPEQPGPGPLALCTGLAALHAALLAPAIARGHPAWGLLTLPLALPALAATSFGHAGAWPLLGSLALVGLACFAGGAARAISKRLAVSLYLPTMILLFAAPYALRYLVLEFGAAGAADRWLSPSPWAAAGRVAAGGALPALCVLALAAWPVWALARGRR